MKNIEPNTEYDELRKMAKTDEDKKDVEKMIIALDEFRLACNELEEATKDDDISWHFHNEDRKI